MLGQRLTNLANLTNAKQSKLLQFVRFSTSHTVDGGGELDQSKQFQSCRLGQFVQERPELRNPFESDLFGQKLLSTWLPADAWNFVQKDLTRFGERIVNEIDPLGLECEREKPFIEQVDAWGKTINRLHVSAAWKRQKEIAAEEQLIRIGYQRPFDEFR